MSRLQPAFILAAPSSHSGKTSVTLGLLRALSVRGLRVASAKIGPDYIDPAFHTAACGRTSLTLDPWAMPPGRLADQLRRLRRNSDLILIESAMGLFDGAADGSATTASLAKQLGLPIVLLVDSSGMAGSVAALVHGFANFDPALHIAGVILNKVASIRHANLLSHALAPLGLPILGALPRSDDLHLPSRHLGLVQAGDTPELTRKLTKLSTWVDEAGLPDSVAYLPLPLDRRPKLVQDFKRLAPLGQHTAVAKDAAFSFIYEHMLDDWRAAGTEISFVSPLAGKPLPSGIDSLYLPGGYPELHAPALSAATRFWQSVAQLAAQGGWIYGECGGFMALGQRLVDETGKSWTMAGLLDCVTRFDAPRRHLGYRSMQLASDTPFGAAGTAFRGHEFHYSCQEAADLAGPLWTASDARGNDLGPVGQIKDRVFGSYLHLVDSQA